MFAYEKCLRKQGCVLIAGIDEAGRGPLAGPVVAAACILPAKASFPLLNDSKQLSPKQRETLFTELTKTKGIYFGIGQATESEIDQHNILQATFLAMQRAVAQLQVVPDYLLIDGNQMPKFNIPKQAIVRGDTLSGSIAAASVLAKVTRDRLMLKMDEQFPKYGFAKHKGYGTKQHLDAIRKWGPCLIHRKTFAPIKTHFL